MPQKLAAGNWKMNGRAADLAEIAALLPLVEAAACEVLVCPPATLIDRMRSAVAGAPLALGGQDCHPKAAGAHTGDISAAMLKDAGATYVIVGHSERRADHGETSETVCAKATAAQAEGLTAVVCVGETLSQREAGRTLQIVGEQLAASAPDGSSAANLVVAYEPVWAIGTGRTPTLDQIAQVHALMRDHLSARLSDGADVALLYGGSVKPANAAEIFAIAHVNGALVGGASLKAADFVPIITALDAA